VRDLRSGINRFRAPYEALINGLAGVLYPYVFYERMNDLRIADLNRLGKFLCGYVCIPAVLFAMRFDFILGEKHLRKAEELWICRFHTSFLAFIFCEMPGTVARGLLVHRQICTSQSF